MIVDFHNAGSWSIETMSGVCKLLCELSPSTKIWPKSLLTQLNICFIWVQHNAYNALHAQWMPGVSPNNWLFLWWKDPCTIFCKLKVGPGFVSMSQPFNYISQVIAWIHSLKHINTIRAILRFKYLDILTTFLFLELSTKNDNQPFPFDDNDCALSKYKPIALR